MSRRDSRLHLEEVNALLVGIEDDPEQVQVITHPLHAADFDLAVAMGSGNGAIEQELNKFEACERESGLYPDVELVGAAGSEVSPDTWHGWCSERRRESCAAGWNLGLPCTSVPCTSRFCTSRFFRRRSHA